MSTNVYWYHYGTTNGNSDSSSVMGGKSFCSMMLQINSKYYTAICPSGHYSDSDWYDNPCPKGWGKNNDRYPDDTYSVRNAQGYVKNSKPIYSTVTKYRDTVYNYTAGRIAKA